MSVGPRIVNIFSEEPEVDLSPHERARLIIIINRTYQAGFEQGIAEVERRLLISDRVMAAIQ